MENKIIFKFTLYVVIHKVGVTVDKLRWGWVDFHILTLTDNAMFLIIIHIRLHGRERGKQWRRFWLGRFYIVGWWIIPVELRKFQQWLGTRARQVE